MNNVGDKIIISISGFTVCADIIGTEPLTVRIGKSSRLVIGANERAQIINVNTGRTYGNVSKPTGGRCGERKLTKNDNTKRNSGVRKYYRVNP